MAPHWRVCSAQKIARDRLHGRQRRQWCGLGAQHSRPQAAGLEIMLFGQREFVVAEAAFGADQHTDTRCMLDPRCQSAVGFWGEEQTHAAGISPATGARKIRDRFNRWHAIASALLAGADRDRAPMLAAFGQALRIEAYHAALAAPGDDGRDAKLGGFLYDQIHTLAACERLQQRDVQW